MSNDNLQGAISCHLHQFQLTLVNTADEAGAKSDKIKDI